MIIEPLACLFIALFYGGFLTVILCLRARKDSCDCMTYTKPKVKAKTPEPEWKDDE